MKFITLLFVLINAFTLSSVAETEDRLKDRYFVKVWSFQGKGNLTTHAHTFASFYNGNNLSEEGYKPPTISWLPKTQIVRRFTVETGHNFSLRHTLKIAEANKRYVKAWGPYEVSPTLYRSALRRIKQLESGSLKYSMLNMRADAPNCIKALSAIAGPLKSGTAYGFKAGELIVGHLSSWMPNYPEVEDLELHDLSELELDFVEDEDTEEQDLSESSL